MPITITCKECGHSHKLTEIIKHITNSSSIFKLRKVRCWKCGRVMINSNQHIPKYIKDWRKDKVKPDRKHLNGIIDMEVLDDE